MNLMLLYILCYIYNAFDPITFWSSNVGYILYSEPNIKAFIL